MQDPGGRLLDLTRQYLPRSRAIYSGHAQAALALLSDGNYAPGVRVETASFSLLIDAPANAVSTAVAAGRTDIVAVALSTPASEAQAAFLTDLPTGSLTAQTARLFTLEGENPLPSPQEELDPFVDPPASESRGVAEARRLASRALIPESSFPVGAIAVLTDGRAVPGVNVEHSDWNRILCAERNAVGTTITYALGPIEHLYLSCPLDPEGSPCGACRQVLAELAPGSTIVMDRGTEPPDMTTPDDLLPGSFTGTALLRSHAADSSDSVRS